jgi:ribonuclease HI
LSRQGVGGRYIGVMAGQAPRDVVEVHTDGACSGNPGPGGWGAVLRYGSHVKEICGGELGPTTNNRMELTAAIEALSRLKRPIAVRLHTDSTYVRDGITKWLRGWLRNGWLTADKKPVKNDDLWRRLAAAVELHEVEWIWVRGHAGDPGNERADALANQGLLQVLNRQLP